MVILKFLKHKDTCRVDEFLKQLIDKINYQYDERRKLFPQLLEALVKQIGWS